MTVDDEISRIETGKDGIRKFSESRGVSIPASETIDHYTQYLNQIQTGKGENEVFFAEYNVTSFQDVLAAFKAGKNIWVTNLGNIFIPLFKVDNTENPQLFIFQQSYNAHNVEVQLGLSDQGTYWESDQPRTSADSISAVVPADSGIRENVQSYLDYLSREIPDDAVLTAPQELTEEQKKQARENIGALPVGLGMTGATVGQIAKIKAVDAAGKVTEWEPVDMPGGGEYELLVDETIKEGQQNVSRISKYFPPCVALVVELVGPGKVPSNIYGGFIVGSEHDADYFYTNTCLYFGGDPQSVTRYTAEIRHGLWFAEATAALQGTASSTFSTVDGLTLKTVEQIPIANHVHIDSYSGKFIANSTIKIYGVRA